MTRGQVIQHCELSLPVVVILRVRKAVAVQQDHTKQMYARYLASPILLIYRCAEKHYLGRLHFRLPACSAEGMSDTFLVLFSFLVDAALNSSVLEFNLSFMSAAVPRVLK